MTYAIRDWTLGQYWYQTDDGNWVVVRLRNHIAAVTNMVPFKGNERLYARTYPPRGFRPRHYVGYYLQDVNGVLHTFQRRFVVPDRMAYQAPLEWLDVDGVTWANWCYKREVQHRSIDAPQPLSER